MSEQAVRSERPRAPTRREIARAWAPAAVYMLAIWIASSFELPPGPVSLFPLRDKGVHFVEYGLLAFLVTHAGFRTWPSRAGLRVFAVGFFVTTAWGLLDEIHQAFVPGRSADVLDLLADTLGAATGALGCWLLVVLRRR